MTEIYIEISKLTDKFRTMAYGLTTDENKINEAVQELIMKKRLVITKKLLKT